MREYAQLCSGVVKPAAEEQTKLLALVGAENPACQEMVSVLGGLSVLACHTHDWILRPKTTTLPTGLMGRGSGLSVTTVLDKGGGFAMTSSSVGIHSQVEIATELSEVTGQTHKGSSEPLDAEFENLRAEGERNNGLEWL